MDMEKAVKSRVRGMSIILMPRHRKTSKRYIKTKLKKQFNISLIHKFWLYQSYSRCLFKILGCLEKILNQMFI